MKQADYWLSSIGITLIIAALNGGAMGETSLSDDFQSYTAGSGLCSQSDWAYNPAKGNCNLFLVQQDGEGKVLSCPTNNTISCWRSVEAQEGSVDLIWRWKADNPGAKLAVGISIPSATNPGDWGDFRARVVLDAGTWNVRGAAWADQSGWPTWNAGVWYFMRVAFDIAAGTFSVYLDTDPARSGETVLVSDAALPAAEPLQNIMIKANAGAGNVMVDDIMLVDPMGSPPEENPDGEDLSTWQYSQDLYLNTTPTGANVSGTVENFPVLIRLDATNFDFSQANPDGSDLRFIGHVGPMLPAMGPIPFEIESWDADGKSATVWVLVAEILGNNAAQYITMYWGKPNAASQTDGAGVFGPAGLAAVWHLGETGTVMRRDASGNGHDATPGNHDGDESVDGVVWLADHQDGENEYLEVPNPGFTGTAMAELTLSAWIKPGSAMPDWGKIICKRNAADSAYSYALQFNRDDSVFICIEGTNGSPARVPYGVWSHVTGVFDGSELLMYVDGQLTAASALSTTVAPSDNPLYLGSRNTSTSQDYEGSLDEIRIALVARSADWVKLCYENQRLEQTLVQFGNDEMVPAPPSGLVAATSGMSIDLTWTDNSDNESGFTISAGTTGENLAFLADVGPNERSFTHDLACGKKSYYCVQAYNGAGASVPLVSEVAGYTVPCTPSSISATTVSESEIMVNWTSVAPITGAAEIEFVLSAIMGPADCAPSAECIPVEIYRGTGTTFMHSGIPCGTEVEYQVRSGNAGGESGWVSTTQWTGQCTMDPPTNLAAVETTPGTMDLSWVDNATTEDGYRVFRKESAATEFVELAVLPADATAYSDATITCTTTYQYYVQAYATGREGGASGQVEVTSAFCGAGKSTSEMITLAGMIPSDGATPTNATKVAVARLYAAPDATVAAYEESFAEAPIVNGYFALTLGLTGDVATVIRENESLYYDVLIDGTSVFRGEYQPLAASPYAISNAFNLYGEGSPVGTVSAPVGASYVDTKNRALYMKSGEGEDQWMRVGQ